MTKSKGNNRGPAPMSSHRFGHGYRLATVKDRQGLRLHIQRELDKQEFAGLDREIRLFFGMAGVKKHLAVFLDASLSHSLAEQLKKLIPLYGLSVEVSVPSATDPAQLALSENLLLPDSPLNITARRTLDPGLSTEIPCQEWSSHYHQMILHKADDD